MIELRRIHLSASASERALNRPCVACLGTFDGVHRGHQKLVGRAIELKRELNLPAALISFYPHPAVVLGRATAIPKITRLRQRLRILQDLSVDLLYLVRFDRNLSRLSARAFVEEVLLSKLNVQALVIGPDASVGREREGSAAVLKQLLEASARRCEILDFLQVAGAKVSSRSIREALALADVGRARDLLGRSFVVEERVVRGVARGNQIGFKTLNFREGRQIWPKLGVYATRVFDGQGWHNGVTNVGVRPTFGGGEKVMETHLLDYSGPDLYGRIVRVAFEKFLRDELRFSRVEELTKQISKDIESAKQILRSQ